MKKIFICIIASFLVVTSVFAYNLTTEDTKKAQLIASKIEILIKKKWEVFRNKYIASLTKIQTKSTSNPKLQAIIGTIVDLLDSNNQKAKQTLDNIWLKISYPKTWWKIEADSNNNFNILQFSNLKDNNDNFSYKNTDLSFGVISYNEVLNWNKNFQGWWESNMYNLKFFEYMKTKFTSFDSNCTETIMWIGKCLNLKKEKIGNDEYLSYIEFWWSGDWYLEKTRIRFIDDKLISISLNLGDGISNSKVIDKIVYPNWNGVNFDINKIVYADFKIDETKLSLADKNIASFLSSIILVSTSQKEQVTKYTIPSTWKSYKNESYKFSLKYPSELPVEFNNEEKSLRIGTLPFEPSAGSMGLYILDKNISEYRQYTKENNEWAPCSEEKTVAFSSIMTYNIICKSWFTGDDIDIYFFENNWKVYEFSFIKSADDSKNEVFRKIISTFEFLK